MFSLGSDSWSPEGFMSCARHVVSDFPLAYSVIFRNYYFTTLHVVVLIIFSVKSAWCVFVSPVGLHTMRYLTDDL